MKKVAVSILSLLAICLGLYTATSLLKIQNTEILIQSLESRTDLNTPVYNKIKYIQAGAKEVWMMNQSHFGLAAEFEKWERIAIVVENKEVNFYQIKPGPLEWSDDLINQQVAYRATCFMCHTNGPRVIRPDFENYKISWQDRIKIFFMNKKIKSYGRLTESKEMLMADQTREVPFKHKSVLDNQQLNIKTCVQCHNEKMRGSLTRQNSGVIEFMVKNKLMPPRGRDLSSKESKQIEYFVQGL